MAWEDQYKRMQRGLVRIQDSRGKNRDEFEDELFHFFQDCWHLKDWILNDGVLSDSMRKAMVTAAERSDALTLCYDVATFAKHFNPRKPQQGGTAIGKISVGSCFSIEYVITDNKGREQTAVHVAQQANTEWTQIITGQGLTLPS